MKGSVFLILGVLAILVGFAIWRIRKNKGCSCNCGCCSGCDRK